MTILAGPRRLYNNGTIESTPVAISVTRPTTVGELVQWLTENCDPMSTIEIECDHDEDYADKYLDVLRSVTP